MLTGGADCIQNHEGLYRITYMKMPAVWSSAMEATHLATRCIQNMYIERGLSTVSRSDTCVALRTSDGTNGAHLRRKAVCVCRPVAG